MTPQKIVKARKGKVELKIEYCKKNKITINTLKKRQNKWIIVIHKM